MAIATAKRSDGRSAAGPAGARDPRGARRRVATLIKSRPSRSSASQELLYTDPPQPDARTAQFPATKVFLDFTACRSGDTRRSGGIATTLAEAADSGRGVRRIPRALSFCESAEDSKAINRITLRRDHPLRQRHVRGRAHPPPPQAPSLAPAIDRAVRRLPGTGGRWASLIQSGEPHGADRGRGDRGTGADPHHRLVLGPRRPTRAGALGGALPAGPAGLVPDAWRAGSDDRFSGRTSRQPGWIQPWCDCPRWTQPSCSRSTLRHNPCPAGHACRRKPRPCRATGTTRTAISCSTSNVG